jgi:hypothetical protein
MLILLQLVFNFLIETETKKIRKQYHNVILLIFIFSLHFYLTPNEVSLNVLAFSYE